MTTHELKTHPAPFSRTIDGLKTFEIRKDDRGFSTGDAIVLREWSPCFACCEREGDGDPCWTCEGERGHYTGRVFHALVTHIERGPSWGLPDGLVVMSLGSLPKRSG